MNKSELQRLDATASMQRLQPAPASGHTVSKAQLGKLQELAKRITAHLQNSRTDSVRLTTPGNVAFFSGPSGTGKTAAAQALAQELGVNLYRIDLSQVVSRYIGETEKNLSTIFKTAEVAGAVLFFDEGDALFGKRSEIKDGQDRYPNLEIQYFLQQSGAYAGPVIVACTAPPEVQCDGCVVEF